MDKDTNPTPKGWHQTPPLPLTQAPYWHRPFSPGGALFYFIRSWRPISERVIFLILATLIWLYATPEMARMQTLSFDWMAEIWLRNMALIILIAGGLHLWLHRFKKQADDTLYETRPFLKNNGRFTFRNQVYDNMFWSLSSGVLVWTAYEVLMMWAYANGYATMISLGDNPLAFGLILLAIPFWAGAYFYAQHRLLHIGPLYRHIHSWHHKNIQTGPWSGLAMHPAEHVILMSDCLIFLLIPSHPIHVIFNLLFHGLGAPTSHAGFDKLRLGPVPDLQLGDFFHQLHHKYFDCNYGTTDTPWDSWFHTFHDGTDEGTKQISERRKMLAKSQTSGR